MVIILKNISASTLVLDIQNFLNPALEGFFKKSGSIEDIKIQMLQSMDSNYVEYNALVRIEPDAAARRVIKVLNWQRCNQKPISLSEFHLRLYQNDQRKNRYQKLNSKRKADRRRRLKITDVTAEKSVLKFDFRAIIPASKG
jgi:hypothetical protein